MTDLPESFLSVAYHELAGHVLAAGTLTALVERGDEAARAFALPRLHAELGALRLGLRAVFRLMGGVAVGATAPVDAVQIVRSAISKLGYGRVDLSGGPAPVVVDADALGDAVDTVLVFAVRDQDTRVEVEAAGGSTTVGLTFRFPTPAEVRDPANVFDAVLEGPSARMGLAFARAVVEAHGGSVAAQLVGESLQVVLHLPVPHSREVTDGG